ncbi:unnamed protein product [Cuscuta europaea]|uniref:Uncharacterized protein n=1 Tax=Cuscuta europaea TaxID=41803 RepID=A0A9P0ZGU6_CUSEU|nr:unnamed protein product [Cuscuta europaea]
MELRDRFRRHPKVGSAALEKDGSTIAKIPAGRTKQVSIKDFTADKELFALSFRRYRFLGETDEKYPVLTGGVNMDAGKLFALKKKGKSQAQKKDPSVQPPVGAFFQKEAPEPSAAEGVVGVAEGATKKKKGGKVVEPPTKKQRGTVAQDAPLVIIEDRPSPDPPVDAAVTAQINPPLRNPPREILQLSLAPGASVLHGSAEPKAFLRGMTSVMDKAALSTYDDEALENRILQSSLTACVALGEHARRLEQWRLRKAEQDREMKELVLKNSEAVKQMAMLEEDLRKAAEGKAAAEEARCEAERAAKKAAEVAEIAKAEAVAKARKEAVAAFVAEGWKTEDRRQWVASMVESSVDDWVKGPGADWMAERGDSYYQGASSSPSIWCTGGSPGTSRSLSRNSTPRLMAFLPCSRM